MAKTYDYYREKGDNYDYDEFERQQRWAEERQYFFEKREMQDEMEKIFNEEFFKENDISDVPSTEEDLFRQILDDERNENN